MSSSVRTLLLSPRPLRSLVAARRSYATIPTKNPNPTVPLEPSQEQAMPIGRFYEAILNSGQPIPKVKPEEPASSVKEKQQQQAAGAEADKEPAKRGRKAKAKVEPEPASTATASTAPTASAAVSPKATAKEAASKSSVSSSPSSSSPSSPGPGAAGEVSPPASSVTSSPPIPTPPSTSTSAEDKAKVIFGPSLAGPAERAERLAAVRSKSKMVAGVLVPPKPEEPDNCCMSGCVNCVWDRYRDEMEEWALANTEAERRLAAGGTGEEGMSAAATASEEEGPDVSTPSPPAESPAGHTVVSMDDDGGGSETNWDVGAKAPVGSGRIAKDFWDDDLYKNVPVGIREFMKQEKKLKEKHLREGTSGG